MEKRRELVKKLTKFNRELAEIYQSSPGASGVRIWLYGAIAIFFACSAVERLMSSQAGAVTHSLLGFMSARGWLLVDLAVATLTIAWWYLDDRAKRLGLYKAKQSEE